MKYKNIALISISLLALGACEPEAQPKSDTLAEMQNGAQQKQLLGEAGADTSLPEEESSVSGGKGETAPTSSRNFQPAPMQNAQPASPNLQTSRPQLSQQRVGTEQFERIGNDGW